MHSHTRTHTHTDLFDGAFVALSEQANENIQNHLKHIHMQTIENPASRQFPFFDPCQTPNSKIYVKLRTRWII